MDNIQHNDMQAVHDLLTQSEREDLMLGIKTALRTIRTQNQVLARYMHGDEYQVLTEGIAVTVENLERLIGNCGALHKR